MPACFWSWVEKLGAVPQRMEGPDSCRHGPEQGGCRQSFDYDSGISQMKRKIWWACHSHKDRPVVRVYTWKLAKLSRTSISPPAVQDLNSEVLTLNHTIVIPYIETQRPHFIGTWTLRDHKSSIQSLPFPGTHTQCGSFQGLVQHLRLEHAMRPTKSHPNLKQQA